MQRFVCATCGVQFAASEAAPDGCPICLDERQYVGHAGQRWTTIEQMKADGYRNLMEPQEPGLTAIRTQPSFCIGQRALLIQHPDGNILWDSISYLDEETVSEVNRLGGIKSIAVNHPHFYSSMVTWAERFDAQIYLPAVDRQWVQAETDRIHFWEGDSYELAQGVTMHRIGGHFPGSSVLHWQAGAGGKGVLMTGDTMMVTNDLNWFSFMYSYPNLIPLPAREIARIRDRLLQLEFDRVYGGWIEKVVSEGARAKVERSAARYINILTDEKRQYA